VVAIIGAVELHLVACGVPVGLGLPGQAVGDRGDHGGTPSSRQQGHVDAATLALRGRLDRQAQVLATGLGGVGHGLGGGGSCLLVGREWIPREHEHGPGGSLLIVHQLVDGGQGAVGHLRGAPVAQELPCGSGRQSLLGQRRQVDGAVVVVQRVTVGRDALGQGELGIDGPRSGEGAAGGLVLMLQEADQAGHPVELSRGIGREGLGEAAQLAARHGVALGHGQLVEVDEGLLDGR
jgi:hypothetical protein